MRILLLGEFSALHKNLKEGLVELGHEVTIVSTGDGFKNITNDIDISPKGNNTIIRKINFIYNLSKLLKLVTQYDLVQIINPFIFYQKFFPNQWFILKLINNSKKFYMLAAGDDAYFWKNIKSVTTYNPLDDFLKYDLKKDNYYMQSLKAFKFNKKVADAVNGIIPVSYTYQSCYADHSNLKNLIPVPINLKKIKYTENNISAKIVIFHGLNRYGFKGTKHVEKAFEILSNKYGKQLELIIDGKMPLDRYLELLKRTNIVIDQTNSYYLGVNGIYAMAMGKVVLGGAEPESLQAIGVKKSPIINIKPNPESIVEAIENLIKNKNNITSIGLESRKFVEEIHDYKKVSKKYLRTWKVD